MRKIIFLDMDGVIATPRVIRHGLWSCDPECQKNLKLILDKTDAEIILSSSWRMGTLGETFKLLNENQFDFSDRITGMTPRLYSGENVKFQHIPRGMEIEEWIDTNVHTKKLSGMIYKELGVDYNYVILDDDIDMLYHQRHNFVNTDWETGLTEEDAYRAINILQK